VARAKKIIWKEGMFLQPQHFQQSELFVCDSFHTRFASANSNYYGFTNMVINNDAIVNGIFSLIQAQGVMTDGSVFDIPQNDLTPAARPFEEHFSHDQQSLEVYLALPMLINSKANVSDPSKNSIGVRYKSHMVSYPDEVFGKPQKDIETGDYNFEILFQDEARENYASMPIARLQRNANGKIGIDETYMPPLLQIGASRVLLDKIRALLELLLAKNASLSQGRKQLQGGFAEFGGSEQTASKLLYALNTYSPLLNHYHFVPTIHPFELFQLLMQFTGALCTFSADVSIRKLPKYEHTNFSAVYGVFDTLIRTILGADITAGCLIIPIETLGPATYLCKVDNETHLKRGVLYFGVYADIPEKELIVGTLSRIKVCSRDRLELLIPSAMPGLPLMHVGQPPKELSTKPGFVYFRLDQRGDFWEGIKSSGTIALYFPNQFKNIKMEMLVLKG
jgi:type VI secretion system protein ImpJ